MNYAPGLELIFSCIPPEGEFPVRTHGDIPSALSGKLYSVGPGRFSRGKVQYQHWFDGDGVVFYLDLSTAEPVFFFTLCTYKQVCT